MTTPAKICAAIAVLREMVKRVGMGRCVSIYDVESLLDAGAFVQRFEDEANDCHIIRAIFFCPLATPHGRRPIMEFSLGWGVSNDVDVRLDGSLFGSLIHDMPGLEKPIDERVLEALGYTRRCGEWVGEIVPGHR